jgi:hypothetical protein
MPDAMSGQNVCNLFLHFCSYLNKVMGLVYVTTIAFTTFSNGARGGAMVEALCYKPEGREIDSR